MVHIGSFHYQYRCPEDGIYFINVIALAYGSYDQYLGVATDGHGVYLISVAFQKYNNQPLNLHVTHNYRSLLVSKDYGASSSTTFYNSGLVRYIQGETITVNGLDQGALYGDPSEAIRTFSVMMMYRYM
jgi:hypothetical protein